jgi:hypothetical protein
MVVGTRGCPAGTGASLASLRSSKVFYNLHAAEVSQTRMLRQKPDYVTHCCSRRLARIY